MYEPVHVKLFPGANGCASAGHTTAASPNESAKSQAGLLSIRIPDIGRFPELVTTNENTTESPTRTSIREGDALMVTHNPGNQPSTTTATSPSPPPQPPPPPAPPAPPPDPKSHGFQYQAAAPPSQQPVPAPLPPAP